MHQSSILNRDLDELPVDRRTERLGSMLGAVVVAARKEHDRTCGVECRIHTDVAHTPRVTTMRAWVECEV